MDPAQHGILHGVDVDRILAFWNHQRQHVTDYAFLSTKLNCTGVVVEALKAGGLHHYSPPAKNRIVHDLRKRAANHR